MSNTPVFKSLRLRNLLSFGNESESTELGPLNVLIGPNGSGKSNFIEAVRLLQSIPGNFPAPISNGGGVRSWLWKGTSPPPSAEIELVLAGSDTLHSDLNYQIQFTERSQSLFMESESLREWPSRDVVFTCRGSFLQYRDEEHELSTHENLGINDIDHYTSFLSQRDNLSFDVGGIDTKHLVRMLKSVLIYQDWTFGRHALPRISQFADLPNYFLEESHRNLVNVLNQCFQNPRLKKSFINYLGRFYEGAEDLSFLAQGGTVQMSLQDKSIPDALIPAARFSDGTLRWLALLAILLHPAPPPLVCLEEPELGLHPDMMHVLAELLRDAAERMQLIVTTHSDALIDALSSTPEAVIVCEKEGGCTKLKRLDRDELAIWLKEYSLGNLWRSGQIGGNRW